MIVLKRILVPTDFSETSAAAVNYGVAFARAFGARLSVVHVAIHQEFEGIVESQRVVDEALGTMAPLLPAVDVEATVQNAAREMLGRVLTPQQAQGLTVDYLLLDGGSRAAHSMIIDYARSEEVDLIIMGTHGRGRMAHILMGGVAENVVRKAPCPVLTVRHPEHDFVVPDDAAVG